MIFLTTTAIDIDEELLNRCLVLTVDEDREQTRRSTSASASSRRSRACWRERRGSASLAAAPERAAAAAAALVANPFARAADLPRRQDAHAPRPREVPDADPRDRAAAPAPAAR